MNDGDPRIADETERELSARRTGETLVGCIGIGCVLLTLPLVWVAFGGGPLLLSRLAPLAVFTVIVVGVALTARAPGALTPRSRDPLRPLTRAGAPPLLERPATRATRASLALAGGLSGLALAGYVLAALVGGGRLVWALPVATLAGISLLTQGVMVYSGRVPLPAWRWQRLTIGGGAPVAGAALVGLGFIFTGATLLLALVEGYSWGFIGLALLLMALALSAPLARGAGRHSSTPGSTDWSGEDSL